MQYDLSGGDPAELIAGGIGLIIVLFVALLMLVLTVIIWWKIFSKAGYAGAMGLLMLVPLVNFIMLLVLAFGQWPIHRELEHLKQRHGGSQPQPPAPAP